VIAGWSREHVATRHAPAITEPPSQADDQVDAHVEVVWHGKKAENPDL
jgi:hypothetical protein